MNTLDIVYLTALGVVAICTAFMQVRNQLVYKHRCKALDICVDLCDWQSYEKYSYDQMMWMFSKWTFAQFYPELVKV